MLWYMFWDIFLVMFLYEHMYMDVNTAMRYVTNLHYAVWVSSYYDYVVMLLCYHVVMLSWCYDVMWIGTQQDDHCKYRNELCYKAPLCIILLWCHVIMLLCWFLLSRLIIVNISSRKVIKIHQQYIFLTTILWL